MPGITEAARRWAPRATWGGFALGLMLGPFALLGPGAEASSCAWFTITQNPASPHPSVYGGGPWSTANGATGFTRTDVDRRAGGCSTGTISDGVMAVNKRVDTICVQGTTGNPPQPCCYRFTVHYSIDVTHTATAYAHWCQFGGQYYDRGEGYGVIWLFDETGLCHAGVSTALALGCEDGAGNSSSTALHTVSTPPRTANGVTESTEFVLVATASTGDGNPGDECVATGRAQGYGFARYDWNSLTITIVPGACQ